MKGCKLVATPSFSDLFTEVRGRSNSRNFVCTFQEGRVEALLGRLGEEVRRLRSWCTLRASRRVCGEESIAVLKPRRSAPLSRHDERRAARQPDRAPGLLGPSEPRRQDRGQGRVPSPRVACLRDVRTGGPHSTPKITALPEHPSDDGSQRGTSFPASPPG
jgi:hypothetical protein